MKLYYIAVIGALAIPAAMMHHPSADEVMTAAAVEADWAVSPGINNTVPAPWTLPHEKLKAMFAADRLGGYCGLTAEFVAQRLRQSGYDAFSINYGIPGGDITHVTTILHQDGKFYLMDPTFAATLRHRGIPVDIFEALAGHPYELHQGDTSGRDWLVHASDLESKRARGVELEDCKPIAAIGGIDTLKCHIRRYDVRAYVATMLAPLMTAGLPADNRILIELMRKGLFGVGIVASTETRDAFLNRWRAAGLPIHGNP